MCGFVINVRRPSEGWSWSEVVKYQQERKKTEFVHINENIIL